MKKNFLAVLFALALCSPTFAQWKPAGDKIKTPWGEQLNPKNVLPEYPRRRAESPSRLPTSLSLKCAMQYSSSEWEAR